LLENWGLISEPIKFLDSEDHVWLKMTFWGIWKTVGWGAILYLAAISGIDQALYESARLDGAGRFSTMWHITVPQVMATYFWLFLRAIANILNHGMKRYYMFQNAFHCHTLPRLSL